jgi:hypothetical protein
MSKKSAADGTGAIALRLLAMIGTGQRRLDSGEGWDTGEGERPARGAVE